eukprot:1543466-Pyramimonas_sp.AAC.1
MLACRTAYGVNEDRYSRAAAVDYGYVRLIAEPTALTVQLVLNRDGEGARPRPRWVFRILGR